MLNLKDPLCKIYSTLPDCLDEDNILVLKKSNLSLNELVIEDYMYLDVYRENVYVNLLAEKFCLNSQNLKIKNMSIFSFLIKYSYFYKCQHQSTGSRLLFFILIKFFSNSYVGWRHFLKLPVHGNRTWSNRKSQRRQTKFFDFYMEYYFDKKKYKCQKSKKKLFYTQSL